MTTKRKQPQEKAQRKGGIDHAVISGNSILVHGSPAMNEHSASAAAKLAEACEANADALAENARTIAEIARRIGGKGGEITTGIQLNGERP